MTDFVKTKDIKNNWVLIDATNAIVGRLAVFISKTIRGKINLILLLIWIMVIL